MPLVSIAFLRSPKNAVFFRVILDIWGEKCYSTDSLRPGEHRTLYVLNLKFMTSCLGTWEGEVSCETLCIHLYVHVI